MVFAKKYFPTGCIFFKFKKLLKKMVYLEVCKFERKNTSGWKNKCCEYHRLEYRDRYAVCTFEGRGIFVSEISSSGAKVPLTMHENIINVKALPIFLPKGDSWGFSSFLIPCRTKWHQKSFDINFFRVQPFSYQPISTQSLDGTHRTQYHILLFRRGCALSWGSPFVNQVARR